MPCDQHLPTSPTFQPLAAQLLIGNTFVLPSFSKDVFPGHRVQVGRVFFSLQQFEDVIFLSFCKIEIINIPVCYWLFRE